MASVTHSTVVVVPDDATSPVGTDEWNAEHVITGVRELLTANRNYYVETTGSDSNPGTALLPWATLQHAADYAAENLDLAGFEVRANVGAGTFEGGTIPSMVGGGSFFVLGAGVGSTTLIGSPVTGGVIDINPNYCVVAVADVTFDGTVGTLPYSFFGAAASGLTVYVGQYSAGSGCNYKPGDNISVFGAIHAEGLVTAFMAGSCVIDGSGTSNPILMFGPSESGTIVDFAAWTFTNNPFFGAGAFINPFWGSFYLSLAATYSGAFTGTFLAVWWGSNATFNDPPLVGTSPNLVDATSTVSITYDYAHFYGGHGSIPLAGAPSTVELPVIGTFAMFKNTSSGDVFLAYNDSGSIKKVQLT